jgi:hypothetical protein
MQAHADESLKRVSSQMSDVRWRIELVKKGLLGLWKTDLKEKERMTDQRLRDYHSFYPEPSQPVSPMPMILTPKKEGGKFGLLLVAYRFLSIRMISSPIAMIATIVPIDIGRKYRSAADAGIGVGSAVAAGASLACKYVVAYDS